jgi:hypothetical protein
MDEKARLDALKAMADVITPIVMNPMFKSYEKADWIARRLYDDANYRPDPYPNGKSKPELLSMVDARDTDLTKARLLLREAVIALTVLDKYASQKTVAAIETFLAETNPIKSFDDLSTGVQS